MPVGASARLAGLAYWRTLPPGLALPRGQAVVRNKLGEETTAFERITDGSRAVATGDVVRVNVKPQVVGRVLYFTIPQVCPNSSVGGSVSCQASA